MVVTFLRVHRTHFYAVLTCVAHELRWCIEAHGLAVEESASERGGLIAFQPRGVVRQQGEAGAVGLGKAILTEAHHLLVDTLGKLVAVTTLLHTLEQLVLEVLETPGALPRTHRTA